ncbi:MAG: hypothetical protein IPK60_11470 [Sandaracinaceae bacterium]|nr:hypothetical protein [Sandaracinaceae bacterium]
MSVICASCGSNRSGGRGATDAGVSSDSSPAPDLSAIDCTGVDPAAAEGQRCCPSLGIDACSIDLVCALEGDRTIPLCLPEFVLGREEACTDSRRCAFGLMCRANATSDAECPTDGVPGALAAACLIDSTDRGCLSRVADDGSEMGTCGWLLTSSCSECGDLVCTEFGGSLVGCADATLCPDVL